MDECDREAEEEGEQECGDLVFGARGCEDAEGDIAAPQEHECDVSADDRTPVERVFLRILRRSCVRRG